MSLWSISYLLPPLVSLTLSYTRLARASRKEKKESMDSGKSKSFIAAGGLSLWLLGNLIQGVWTTPHLPLSFLLVCREYILRSKQVKKRTLVGQREWDHLCEISWENQLWNLGCIICFFFFSNFNFIIRVINK